MNCNQYLQYLDIRLYDDEQNLYENNNYDWYAIFQYE